ncbi:MAG: ankyrin repeat domain-containing protein [Syntrophales bacterium]
MNREYADGIKRNIAETPSIIYRVASYFIILIVFNGCVSTNSVIINAAADGDVNTIRKLHNERININEKDSAGATALMYAIWKKKIDAAKYLIESGADIKVKDSRGNDALRYAIDYNQLEIIAKLIENGADMELLDSLGNTPLTHAVLQIANVDAVKLMIRKGANVKVRNAEDKTLLELALDSYTQMAIVAELINAGANLTVPEHGKARLVFIGEEFFGKDSIWVTVGEHQKFLRDSTVAFVDVVPGKHVIFVPVSWYQTKPNVDINVAAEQTYYFTISQNLDNRAAAMVGGVLLETIVAKTSGKDPFFITPIEESVAKGKIKELLSKNK